MPIDLQRESPRSLSDAAKQLPNRPSVRTLFRWSKSGVNGIVLETVKLGHQRYTSDEALKRFFERLTNAAAGRVDPFSSAREREQRIAAAERELDRGGIR